HRSLDRRADEDEEMSPLDRERMLDLESDGHLIGTLLPRPVRVNRPNNFPGCSVYLTRRRNPYDNLLSKPPSSDPATSGAFFCLPPPPYPWRHADLPEGSSRSLDRGAPRHARTHGGLRRA